MSTADLFFWFLAVAFSMFLYSWARENMQGALDARLHKICLFSAFVAQIFVLIFLIYAGISFGFPTVIMLIGLVALGLLCGGFAQKLMPIGVQFGSVFVALPGLFIAMLVVIL